MGCTDLHCHKPVINQYLLREKVCADGGLVTGTEFLVDLSLTNHISTFVSRHVLPPSRRTYWFIKLVFPTPLSPRIITLRPRMIR